MATILDTNVPVQQNTPTFPDTPPGYDPVILYSYPEITSIDPTVELDTTDIYSLSVSQESADSWLAQVNQMRDQFAAQGATILAFGAWQQPVEQVNLPSQYCILGQCFDVPQQVCLPFVGCIGVANQTISAGFKNRLWVLSQGTPAAASGYVGPLTGRAYSSRAFLPILEAVGIILIILSLVYVYSVVTGKITPQQLTQYIGDLAKAPGNNLVAPITSLAVPAIALGATIAIVALLVPTLNLSGSGNATIPIPGGGRIGGTIGAGKGR